MQDVAIVEEREAFADVLKERDDLVEPKQMHHPLLPILKRPNPLGLAQSRRIGIPLDPSFPSTDVVGERSAVRVRHEDVQSRDGRAKGGELSRLHPGVVVVDDVGVLEGFEEVDFAEDSETAKLWC